MTLPGNERCNKSSCLRTINESEIRFNTYLQHEDNRNVIDSEIRNKILGKLIRKTSFIHHIHENPEADCRIRSSVRLYAVYRRLFRRIVPASATSLAFLINHLRNIPHHIKQTDIIWKVGTRLSHHGPAIKAR